MPPEETPGAPPVAPTPASADAGQAASGTDEPLRNYKEVVELRKEVRGVEKLLKEMSARMASVPAPAASATAPDSPAPPAPAAGSSVPPDVAALREQVNALARENALNRAFADYGIKAGSVRELVEDYAKTGRSADEIRGYAEKLSRAMPSDSPSQQAAQPAAAVTPPPAAGRTDTGPPVVSASTSLSANPNKIPIEVYRSLKPEDRKARVQAWLASGDGNNWTRGSRKRA